MPFTAKDVQGVRQAHRRRDDGREKALEATDGDIEAAKQWLREKGLPPAKRTSGQNAPGRRRRASSTTMWRALELRCETDFGDASETSKLEAQTLVEFGRRPGCGRGQ